MAYEPVAGTVPYRVIEHLKSLDEGTELSSTDLAVMLGWDNARGLRSWLTPAVQGGALWMREGGQRLTFYRLGDGREQFPTAGDPQVTRVSAIAVSSVFAYAQERQAASFSTAISSDGRLILQRHGRVIAELTPEEAMAHRKFLAKPAGWEMAND